MKRRRVPGAISKRLRRKLRRSRNPFLLWLRLRRPVIYARLCRYWRERVLSAITSVSPFDTPFMSLAPRVSPRETVRGWEVDRLES